MKTILFELFPTRSHLLMAFKTAKLLHKAGYCVIFGSIPEMKEIIIQHGFEYQFIPYTVVISLQHHLSLKKKQAITLPSKMESLEYARKKLELFNKQVTEINPDLVLLDQYLMNEKMLFYQNLGIKVVFICPMPDPAKTVNVPPFSSSFVPKDTWMSIQYVALLWFLKRLKGKLSFVMTMFFYMRINELSIFKQLAKEQGFRSDLVWMAKNRKELYQRTTPRIILSATDLDFPRPALEGVYPVGPLIDFPEEDYQSTDMRYEAMKNIISRGDASIIYCSLGMLDDFCTRKKISLYRKVRKVALLSPDDFFILSTGDDLNNSDLLPLPPNMFVFKSLPQKDLLKYCTVMINHGGLNSLTECVFSEVPVIAYPPSHQADHSCNAAKVVYHGIGLRGKIGRDSPRDILKKIDKIRGNYDWYLGNIRQMKQKFEEKNNSTEVVNIIESIINRHDNSKN